MGREKGDKKATFYWNHREAKAGNYVEQRVTNKASLIEKSERSNSPNAYTWHLQYTITRERPVNRQIER